MTVELADFEELTRKALIEFDHRLAATGTEQGLLDRELTRLVSVVEQLYAITAILSRRESEMDKTAALWGGLLRSCDEVAARIHALYASDANAQRAYDTVLDIRSAARELQELHQET